MSCLPGSQHNPHNQLPPSSRLPIDEALEILVVQRNRQRNRLVRLELQLIVIVRQYARGLHLLAVHLKDVLVLNMLTVCDVSFIDGRTGECEEIKSIFCTDGTAACAPGECMSIEVI